MQGQPSFAVLSLPVVAFEAGIERKYSAALACGPCCGMEIVTRVTFRLYMLSESADLLLSFADASERHTSVKLWSATADVAQTNAVEIVTAAHAALTTHVQALVTTKKEMQQLGLSECLVVARFEEPDFELVLPQQLLSASD